MFWTSPFGNFTNSNDKLVANLVCEKTHALQCLDRAQAELLSARTGWSLHAPWGPYGAKSRQLQLRLQHYVRVPSVQTVAVATHIGARCAQIYSQWLPSAHRFTVGYCQVRTDLQLITAKCAQIYRSYCNCGKSVWQNATQKPAINTCNWTAKSSEIAVL